MLKELISYNIHSAIFHWYSGPTSLIKDIAAHGFYFSINSEMIKSSNGQKIISAIPKEKILTETDGPFIEIDGRYVRPSDIGLVQDYLSQFWRISKNEVELKIKENFSKLIAFIKP